MAIANLRGKIREFLFHLFVTKVGSTLLTWYTSLTYHVARGIKEIGKEKLTTPLREGRSVICPIWHQRLSCYFKVMGGYNALMMIGRDPKFDIFARFCEKLGMEVIRGGTGQGGKEALEMIEIKCRERPRVVGFAVDGPYGPFHKARPGAVLLSSRLKAPIVPVSWAATKNIQFKKQWDRKIVPLTGAKALFLYGTPMPPPNSLERESISKLVDELTLRLLLTEQKAQSLLHQYF